MNFRYEELNEMAVMVISKYFEGYYTEQYITNNFKLAIKLLVNNASNSINLTGVSSVSENGTSITYRDGYEKFSMTNDVLALLPNKINYRAW